MAPTRHRRDAAGVPAATDAPERAVIEAVTRALPHPVERIDTHAAVVLLGGDTAYKLKRPVRFSFLDFSTPERRERALRAELRLNLRTAPEIYRKVVAVTRAPDGSLAVDGPGEPVEWLLEMRRFPTGQTLDRLADRGALDGRTVDLLAAEIARFHAQAPERPGEGGHRAVAALVDENRRNLLDAGTVDAELVAAVDHASRLAVAAHRDLLDRRRAAGLVRRCHGDLHLGNIVRLDGRPVLFDCIEFSEEYACIDVLYDLAFCVMDLLERGLDGLAQRLLQGWIERTEDDEGLALLPLFLAMRATIRAKVLAIEAGRDPAGARGAERARTAARYLALAARALRPPPPRIVAVGGRSGSGKSAVARALAPHIGAPPGAVVLRTDVIRKRLLGRESAERLGGQAYDPVTSARVYARVAERASTLAAAGHSAVADGVFGLPGQRAEIEAAAAACATPFAGIWLSAGEDVLLRRVGARQGDASDADADVVRAQRAIVPPREGSWTRVDASRALEAVVADVRGSLGASAPSPS